MRILLFTGNGGAGKTTAASATALRLAERGCKTLLLSAGTAHSAGDALDCPIGAEPAEVAPSLWALQFDSQRRLEAAWRGVQAYLVRLLARVGVDPVTAEELAVLPGLEAVLALLAVHELAESGNWDVLVVDCGPAAETLRLLSLPETLGSYLTKVFPAHQRLISGLGPFAGLLGRAQNPSSSGLLAALLQLTAELAAVRALLSDPAITSVRLVLTPEAVVTAEARRAYTALSLYGYRVDLVVANRVFPEGSGAWQAGWVAAQRGQLALLRDSFAGLPIREVPYGAAEPIGVAALRDVADHLYGPLPGADPAAASEAGTLLRVEADGADFLLRMRLPLATRGEVGAVRAGDDLVLTVGACRRVLSLPSVLRRCEVVGGEFVDSELRIRFRPDESVWPRTGGGT
ncbi:MAG TPA: ArsA family ATPase [Jatrophihabitantaceae bacterium]|jgi:arsenite-transporting ATPase|nr:ArsA family ATPase [Jatrophihabitantaceae bacterium]